MMSQHEGGVGGAAIACLLAGPDWLLARESNDDYERYVTMDDALTYKDMFVSLDLLSNNMSGQQCTLPLLPR